jgi:hypothetical protein
MHGIVHLDNPPNVVLFNAVSTIIPPNSVLFRQGHEFTRFVF